jgi:hypothetical protein
MTGAVTPRVLRSTGLRLPASPQIPCDRYEGGVKGMQADRFPDRSACLPGQFMTPWIFKETS